jgi:uncharacterized protein YbcI
MEPIEQRGEALARISTGLVQLHRRHFGKGPTMAKTYLRDDVVVCVLRGGFTAVERTLIEAGKPDAVHLVRRTFQDLMEQPFKDLVQGAIGRRVIAYVSQVHHNPDLAVEFFLLEPEEAAEECGTESGSSAQE